MFVKIFFGKDKLFSGYEFRTQGFEIVLIMYVATSYALLSNAIGLYWANRKERSINDIHLKAFKKESLKSYWQVGYWISMPIVIWAAYAFASHYGETIFNAAYTSKESSTNLTFGATAVIGIIGLYIMFVAGMKGFIRNWKIIFIPLAIYFVIYSQLFHGVRQDAITATFGFLILYGVINQKSFELKLKWIPWFILAYLFLEAWGVLRSTWGSSNFTLSQFLDVVPSMFRGKVVGFGTVSPIATTYSNTVWLINSGKLDFSWGRSYFEFLLRTPPSFMYPNRPPDYAFMFQKYGLSAGGGFFELAEVYMNFGIFGSLIIPGLISFLLARSYHYAMKMQSMLSYFLLFSFLSVFLRGTWYQTFAFYRAFLVSIMLYLLIVFIRQLLSSRRVEQ